MKSANISPKELADACVAAKAHNKALGRDVLTPKYLAGALRRIGDGRATRRHNKALAAIAARCRKVVMYDAANIKRRSVIASRVPWRVRRQIGAANSGDDDDHDINNPFWTPQGTQQKSCGPFFFCP